MDEFITFSYCETYFYIKKMKIDNKLKTFLLSKLNFSAENIRALEKNRDLLNNTLKLIDYLRKNPNRTDATRYIKDEFRKIKNALNKTSILEHGFLKEERKKYYSFSKPARQPVFGVV